MTNMSKKRPTGMPIAFLHFSDFFGKMSLLIWRVGMLTAENLSIDYWKI